MKIKAFYQKLTQGSLRLNLSSTTKIRGPGSQKLKISSSKTRKCGEEKGVLEVEKVLGEERE